MDTMQSVERGAVISISIAGGIVIFSLGAVVIYILRELYCNDHYTNMTSSVRRSNSRRRKKPSKGHGNSAITTINVTPTSSTDRIVPGMRTIALPDSNIV